MPLPYIPPIPPSGGGGGEAGPHAASHADGGADEVTATDIRAVPLASAGLAVDTTYADTVRGSGNLAAVGGAPAEGSVTVFAVYAYDGDAYPALLILNDPGDAILYVGDGTYDPYSQNHYIGFSSGRFNIQPALDVSVLRILGTVATESQVDLVFAPGTSVIIPSPNGTPYRIQPADDGTLTTVDASIVVADTFTRADETPLSAAETGQAYTHPVGTGLSVISNQLGKVTSGTQASGIDTGLTDGVLSFTVAVAAPGSSDFVSFRYADANNQLRLRLLTGVVTEIVGGVTTTLGTLAGEQPFDGDAISVTMDGADLTFLRNGSPDLAVTTSLLTGTEFNVQLSSATGRIDALAFNTL